MKKYLIFIVVIFIFFEISFGQKTAIIITKPTQKTVMSRLDYRIDTREIRWNIVGVPIEQVDEYVAIKLFKINTNTPWYIISHKTPNRGIFQWRQIPSKIDGGFFFLNISTTDGKLSNNSECFEIVKPTVRPQFQKDLSKFKKVTPGIRVETPSSFFKYSPGKKLTIKWSINVNKRVKIQLYTYPKKFYMNIVDGSANIKIRDKYTWKIPSSVKNGIYILKVSTYDNSVSGFSGQFKINSKLKIPDNYKTIN